MRIAARDLTQHELDASSTESWALLDIGRRPNPTNVALEAWKVIGTGALLVL